MSEFRFAVLVALLGVGSAPAQDPTTVRPALVKVEFENEQIRVLRVRYGPHETLPMHSHPGRVVIALTVNHLRATTPDGTTDETRRHVFEIYWGDATSNAVENLENSALESIEIEVKKSQEPGKPVAWNAAAASGMRLKEPVSVEMEPHHHVVYQNQYVRVLDVLFPPGDPALFHTHSNDNVSIELSGDKTKSQTMGGEWSAPADVVPGRLAFHKAKGQPYTHRVGSAGTQAFHVIDVEIFP